MYLTLSFTTCCLSPQLLSCYLTTILTACSYFPCFPFHSLLLSSKFHCISSTSCCCFSFFVFLHSDFLVRKTNGKLLTHVSCFQPLFLSTLISLSKISRQRSSNLVFWRVFCISYLVIFCYIVALFYIISHHVYVHHRRSDDFIRTKPTKFEFEFKFSWNCIFKMCSYSNIRISNIFENECLKIFDIRGHSHILSWA